MIDEHIDVLTDKPAAATGFGGHPNVSSRDKVVAVSLRGRLFSWTVESHTAGSGDIILAITNTSQSEMLHLVFAHAGSQNKVLFDLALFSGTPTGSDAVQASWCPSMAVTPDIIAKQQDVQGLTLIAQTGCRRTSKDEDTEFFMFGAFILGENETIGVVAADGSPAVCGMILAYYE